MQDFVWTSCPSPLSLNSSFLQEVSNDINLIKCENGDKYKALHTVPGARWSPSLFPQEALSGCWFLLLSLLLGCFMCITVPGSGAYIFPTLQMRTLRSRGVQITHPWARTQEAAKLISKLLLSPFIAQFIDLLYMLHLQALFPNRYITGNKSKWPHWIMGPQCCHAQILA